MKCKEALAMFQSYHREYAGDRYIPTYGRDNKIFTVLLKDLSPGDLEKCVKTYFKEKHKWYSPVFLKMNIQRIYVEMRKQTVRGKKLINLESQRYEPTEKTNLRELG